MRRIFAVPALLVLASCSGLTAAQQGQIGQGAQQVVDAGTDALHDWLTEAITNWVEGHDDVKSADVVAALNTCEAACLTAAAEAGKPVPQPKSVAAPSRALVARYAFLAAR